jgi:sulfite reductase (ferredoxin)
VGKRSVEEIKQTSGGLRGVLPEELAAPTERFGEESVQLLKFHGIYQQDNRDDRKSVRETGGSKAYSFMIRTKSPGGYLPAPLYQAVDTLADTVGNGTIRVTTRMGLQLHGVRKDNLREVIVQINEHLGSTLGACGDINRNVMAPPYPFHTPAYIAARSAALAIAELLTPRATAYYEVWQDGEVVHSSAPADEPIYGTAFMPRKFKIAVAAPGDNSVDIYTNDIGVVPVVDPDGSVGGFNLIVGGGLGMTHGKHETFPRLGDEFAYVSRDRLLDAVRAIVLVQRDHGDRTNRRHARMKYLIADRGLDWFRTEVERNTGFALEPWRPLPPWQAPQFFGWHEQGDGRWFYGLEILSGRIRDDADARTKSALREISASTGRDFFATPNQDILIVDVPPEQRATIDAIFAKHGITNEPDAWAANALACPALPTCGLALAEAERYLPSLLVDVRAAWQAAKLPDDVVPTLRMTGCPNSCARPSTGEIGIIGVSADRYNLYIGGNPEATRLNRLYREKLHGAEIAPALGELFAEYAATRRAGESFGDFCLRAQSELVAS